MTYVSHTIGDGRKTVTAAGTAERLVATSGSAQAFSVCITALESNTGKVVVGGSTVVAALATRRGTPLAANESITYAAADLKVIWLDAVVSGEGVSFSYERR